MLAAHSKFKHTEVRPRGLTVGWLSLSLNSILTKLFPRHSSQLICTGLKLRRWVYISIVPVNGRKQALNDHLLNEWIYGWRVWHGRVYIWPSGWEMVSTGPLWSRDDQGWTQWEHSTLVFLLFFPWDHFYILVSGYVMIPLGLKSKWGRVRVPCFIHTYFKLIHTSVYFISLQDCLVSLMTGFWSFSGVLIFPGP